MRQSESSLSIFLHDILERRRVRNPRYSMRAFARDLGISPGRLSDFLSGRRVPGHKLSQRIISALDMTPEETFKLGHLIERQKLLKSEVGEAYQLTEDQFAIVADREHFALLNLMKTRDYRFDLAWISERLGMSERIIKRALERLVRLGLVKEQSGHYLPVHDAVTTSHDIPSSAIREHHRQILTHSISSLFQDDPGVRDVTTMTIPTNPEKIEKAKVLIRDFRRRLAKLLESGDKTEVYQLNIQLVPVTQIKNATELE